MGFSDIAAFTFATREIRSFLLCKFISSGATVFLVLRVCFVIVDKRSELSCCLIEATSEIGRKINYFQAKQRTCYNMQELCHW